METAADPRLGTVGIFPGNGVPMNFIDQDLSRVLVQLIELEAHFDPA